MSFHLVKKGFFLKTFFEQAAGCNQSGDGLLIKNACVQKRRQEWLGENGGQQKAMLIMMLMVSRLMASQSLLYKVSCILCCTRNSSIVCDKISKKAVVNPRIDQQGIREHQ
jgi:hypothetical protein